MTNKETAAHYAANAEARAAEAASRVYYIKAACYAPYAARRAASEVARCSANAAARAASEVAACAAEAANAARAYATNAAVYYTRLPPPSTPKPSPSPEARANVWDSYEEYIIDSAYYDALGECNETQWLGDQEYELYWLHQVNEAIDLESGYGYK